MTDVTRAPDRVAAWEVAAFAAAFAVAACVVLALLWANGATYGQLVGGPSAFTRLDTGERVPMSLDSLSRFHGSWLAYVTGLSAVEHRSVDLQPAATTPWFTEDERRHMSDVRGVFVGAELLGVASIAALAGIARRAARRGTLARLCRSGALAAALALGALGAVFALAFEAAFLLFHELLFPQGNFLFPAGSNLLVVYPERYWYGMTVRIAVSFLGLAALVAVVAHVALLRPRSR